MPPSSNPIPSISASSYNVNIGDSVTLTVSATDADGTMTGLNLDKAEGGYFRVDAGPYTNYTGSTPNNGNMSFGATSSKAQSCVISFGVAGTYNFKGMAYDGGAWYASSPISITVAAAPTYNLTVVTDGTAGCSTSGSASGVSGNAVQAISASAGSGYAFDSWSVISGSEGGSLSAASASTNFTMNNVNATVRANFRALSDPGVDFSVSNGTIGTVYGDTTGTVNVTINQGDQLVATASGTNCSSTYASYPDFLVVASRIFPDGATVVGGSIGTAVQVSPPSSAPSTRSATLRFDTVGTYVLSGGVWVQQKCALPLPPAVSYGCGGQLKDKAIKVTVVPGTTPMTNPTSSNATIYEGTSWEPTINIPGGNGTGATAYCIAGRTYWTLSGTQWTAPAGSAGTYDVYVGQFADASHTANSTYPDAPYAGLAYQINYSKYTLTVLTPTYSITVQTDGTTGCTASGSATGLSSSANPAISATADATHLFDYWENVSGNGSIGNATLASTNFNMSGSDVTVKAHFKSQPLPTGSVTVTPTSIMRGVDPMAINMTGSATSSLGAGGAGITVRAELIWTVASIADGAVNVNLAKNSQGELAYDNFHALGSGSTVLNVSGFSGTVSGANLNFSKTYTLPGDGTYLVNVYAADALGESLIGSQTVTVTKAPAGSYQATTVPQSGYGVWLTPSSTSSKSIDIAP